MVAVEKNTLEDSLKNVTLAILGELSAHHVKGADLLLKCINQFEEHKAEYEQYYEILKTLISLLKPVFEIAREWLTRCYAHLVALFDWAKAKWQEIFG